MKDHLIFDTTDATTIADTDSVGAFVRANDGSLITKHIINQDTKASLIAQGLLFESILPGAIGNTYSFEVVDTGGSGPLSFTEVGGAIVLDLVGLTPTTAQVASFLSTNTYAIVTAVTPTGNVVVAAELPFAGGSDTSIHNHLDVYAAMADGAGNPISSTNGALDVNITNAINVDINGIYNVSTNPTPDNVGIIGSSRAAPGLANQTLQFTGGNVSTDGLSPTNIVAQDTNAFGMMWNGTGWDRMTGASATGLKVDITDATIAVTQSGTWTVGLSEDHNYGAVGANTLRTASQIGNATGAADFNAGVTTAQTLRVVIASDYSDDAALADTAIANAVKVLAVADTPQQSVTTALANRKYLWIYNNDNTKVYVGASAGLTAANGFPISPGSYMEFRAGAAITPYFVGQTAKTPEIRTLEFS
jgi:hypothetical protein